MFEQYFRRYIRYRLIARKTTNGRDQFCHFQQDTRNGTDCDSILPRNFLAAPTNTPFAKAPFLFRTDSKRAIWLLQKDGSPRPKKDAAIKKNNQTGKYEFGYQFAFWAKATHSPGKYSRHRTIA